MIITLSAEDLEVGRREGIRRHVHSRQRGLKSNFYDEGNEMDVLGAQGEIAAAQCLWIPFEPKVDTFKAADIGVNLQVRTTPRSNGRLIIKKGDNPDHIYILVRKLSRNDFEVVGWIFGHEGQRPEYLTKVRHGGSVFFVPNYKLKSIDDLFVNDEFRKNLAEILV